MQIQIDPHTLERAQERGANAQEIAEVIRNGQTIPAKLGRLARELVFDFRGRRQGIRYEHKKVQVIYIVEGELVITVTVYVFYGYWEGRQP